MSLTKSDLYPNLPTLVSVKYRAGLLGISCHRNTGIYKPLLGPTSPQPYTCSLKFDYKVFGKKSYYFFAQHLLIGYWLQKAVLTLQYVFWYITDTSITKEFTNILYTHIIKVIPKSNKKRKKQ